MLLGSAYEPCVRELLQDLDQEALLGLTLTATNNRIHPTSFKEAIEVILMHTEDLGKFFSYRRIKAQVLFMYLHKQKILANAHSSKTQLAVAVQQYWMQRINETPSATQPKRKNNSIPEQKPVATVSRQPPPVQSSSGLELVECHQNKNTSIQPSAVHANQGQQLSKPVMSDEFARTFSEWYYTMINYLQPACANQPGDKFRENIFCNNSSVEIYFVSQVTEGKRAAGQAESYALLREVLAQTELLFSPNLFGGTQAQKSEHGMVKIFSSGTLHKLHSFVGIYEQEFGLVFSPIDRAWKIMYTKMNLKQATQETKPLALPPCEIFQIEHH